MGGGGGHRWGAQVEVRDELHLSVQELGDSSGYRPQSS